MEIINHKGKYYLKTETGYREVLATTDSSLKVEIDGNRGNLLPDISFDISLPQPSQAFIEKYVEEYNKGNIITDVLVEYEGEALYTKQQHFMGYKYNLKINPKDNTITIKKVKDSWSRDEVEILLDDLQSDIFSHLKSNSRDEFYLDKWIEENL